MPSNAFNNRLFAVVFVSIFLFAHIYKWHKMDVESIKDILFNAIIGSSFLLLSLIKNLLELMVDVPWFIHSFSNMGYHISLLIFYSTMFQMFNDIPHYHIINIRSKTTITVFCLLVLMLLFDTLSRNDYISPTSISNNTVLDNKQIIGFLFYFSSFIPIRISTIILNIKNIVKITDIYYQIRFLFWLIAYLLGVIMMILADGNLIYSISNGYTGYGIAKWTQDTGSGVCVLFILIGILPQSIYNKSIIPFIKLIKFNTNNNTLSKLSYLHNAMESIIPITRFESIDTDDTIQETDILIEISDMRHVILSHFQESDYNSAKKEALLIHNLQINNKKISSSGLYNPIMHQENVMKYNLSVANHLIKMDSIFNENHQRHSSYS